MTPAVVTIYQTRTAARALLAAATGALGVTLLLGFTDYAYLATPAALVAGLVSATMALLARATRMELFVDGETEQL